MTTNEAGDEVTDGTMEFVEIYNTHDEHVSLEGWRLDAKRFLINLRRRFSAGV